GGSGEPAEGRLIRHGSWEPPERSPRAPEERPVERAIPAPAATATPVPAGAPHLGAGLAGPPRGGASRPPAPRPPPRGGGRPGGRPGRGPSRRRGPRSPARGRRPTRRGTCTWLESSVSVGGLNTGGRPRPRADFPRGQDRPPTIVLHTRPGRHPTNCLRPA